MKNFAHLKEDSPFYPLFAHGLVPIKNILVPNQAECLGDGIQDVYMVDVEKLTHEQFERVVRMITSSCPDLREQCVQDIERQGLPLRSKHVSGTSSDCPFFL